MDSERLTSVWAELKDSPTFQLWPDKILMGVNKEAKRLVIKKR